MKKAIIILLVGLMMISSLMAQEKPVQYKASFTLYTKTLYDRVRQYNPTFSHEDAIRDIVNRYIHEEVQLKKVIMNTDKNLDAQWVYFGPFQINYEEDVNNPGQSITDIYGGLTTEGQPLKKGLDSLKKVYKMETINPFILTEWSDFVKKGENIMIRTASKALTDYAGSFLTMVNTRTGKNTLTPMYRYFPEKHPSFKSNWRYGTLGTASANWIFPVFAHKDSALIHFDTPEGKKDSVYFPLGDDDHNVLDPDYGWDLSVVMDRSGVDLGFQTRSDTLTVQQGLNRHIELYPGWNDENVGKVLYVASGNFYNVQPIFTDEYHCRYFQDNGFSNSEDLGGYAVDIPHLADVFALEYILVRYIDGLEIPGISVPTDIQVGEDFTVTLTGTPDLMTSWIPEVTTFGVDAELIARDGWTYTYRAKTAGTLGVKLHHNSLQVLSDTTVTRTVTPNSVADEMPLSIKIYPNPTENNLSIISTELQIVNISIYDIVGATKLIQYSDFQNIDLINLPKGTYVLQIQTSKQVFHSKFTKI